mmetsp:Transcript_55588/g.110477  ORF Transcript_55588/g.110477 Transcript_55588/m.110477 type:complete len:308 (+) Transcript_55588:176-1099(+)
MSLGSWSAWSPPPMVVSVHRPPSQPALLRHSFSGGRSSSSAAAAANSVEGTGVLKPAVHAAADLLTPMQQTRGVSLDSAVSTAHKRGCSPTDLPGTSAGVDVRELRDSLLHELQDCTNGQQRLHVEVKQHQQFVQEGLARVEKTLAELCEELPQLREQFSAQTREITRISELQSSCFRKAEELERGLAEESEARYDAERAHNSDLLGWGNHVATKVDALEAAVAEVRRQQQQQQQQQQQAKRSGTGSSTSPPSPLIMSVCGSQSESGRGLLTSRSDSSSRPRTPSRVRQVVLNDRARRCLGGSPSTA